MKNKKIKRLMNKRVIISLIFIASVTLVASIVVNLSWQAQDERELISKKNAILAYIKEKKDAPYSVEEEMNIRH
jgi:Na+-transporting NADH:ubiquinone oxidoreductase subunit NqrC